MVSRMGTRVINTESRGERDFNTSGTHITEIALDYQRPIEPDEYHKKDKWLERCQAELATAAKTKKDIDDFAYDRTAVTPGFFTQQMWEANLKPGLLFNSAVEGLGKVYIHECRLAVWERTRVCCRCGESFITPKDRAAAKPGFDIPTFHFPKQDERCPDCNSYQWKTSNAYFEALLHVEMKVLETQEKQLKQAKDYANNENPPIFDRFLSMVSLISTVDDAEKALAAQSEKVDSLKRAWQTAVDEFPNYPEARVCTQCEKMYCLTDND